MASKVHWHKPRPAVGIERESLIVASWWALADKANRVSCMAIAAANRGSEMPPRALVDSLTRADWLLGRSAPSPDGGTAA
jgi:hypothetical protein